MLKYLLNRLFGRPTVRTIRQGNTFLYRHRNREVYAGVAVLPDGGYGIDLSSVELWRNGMPQVGLNSAERLSLAEEVRAVIKSQWGDDLPLVGRVGHG